MILRPTLGMPIVLYLVLCLSAIGCRRESQDERPQPEVRAPTEPVAGPPAKPALGRLPLSFVENKGQLDATVKYVARGPRGSVFFTPTEVVFEIVERRTPRLKRSHVAEPETVMPEERRGVVVRVSFPGANTDPVVEGRNALPGKVSVLRGTDSTKWQTDIRSYAAVAYRDIYPGIDLVFAGEMGELTRKFVIRPEGDIGTVRMRYAGIESLELTDDGAIRIKTAIGTIRERTAGAELVTDDTAAPVKLKPQLIGEFELGFAPTPE